ncbi:MAG: hypothetical protein JST89_17375 [Cyanobacteria bacterium SZAS-4]|nr:hypothetical protein [Cyanobacteria bacterium SZAS-4]
MNKSNWIKILAIACLVVWLVALSLANLLDKRTPAKLMSVETRWSNLNAEQTRLETATKTLSKANLESARKLISIYEQQNLFSRAQSLAEKILQLAGDDSLSDLENLATVERQNGDYKKCLLTLEQIAKLDQSDSPKSARDQINLGTVHYLNGLSMETVEERKLSFQKARDCFTAAERLIPTDSRKMADLIALKENRVLNDRELKKLEQN